MTGLILDESQERAVDLVCTAKLGVVTGGPGTGKSTCLRVALDRLDRAGVRYELASPTGKAARRLSEATEGRNARTLHRLLEYNPGRGGFQRNSGHPLECDIVIVDEASMVDLELFAALMRAVRSHRTRVILVGDANQLPPVGPGRPFGDMVARKVLPTVRLEVLHRAAQTSWIHVAAQDLLRGRQPALEKRVDFVWMPVNDPVWILRKIKRLVTEVFVPGGPIDAEVQVLIPQHQGVAGIQAANAEMQSVLNPKRANEPVFPRNLWEIRKRDVVIQTRNDYDLNVFNGEIGRTLEVGPLFECTTDEHGERKPRLDKFGQPIPMLDSDGRQCEGVRVQFAGHEELSTYVGGDVNALQLAYALTVHRSQGSEFPWAIVVCHSCYNPILLSRQLLYTAITRAKRGVVLVGDQKGLERAIKNARPDHRNTTLVTRLDGLLERPEHGEPLLEETG